ncbi:unnamed protein product [Mytilus coruscus]|uniref:C1q domain-containing protein n=1 Tax=Mytilus coruscus TaxID=42192 RepID=A0A6J8BZH3_MYTCO|nr:unnamed protein product [Mytilus coruscus]
MFVFNFFSVWILCREITITHGSELACSEKSNIVNKLKLLCDGLDTGKESGDRSTGVNVSGFSASVSRPKYVVRGHVVRFDKVWNNVGNNYDPQSGIYTAPKDGAYNFSCTVMSIVNKLIRVNLMKNNLKTVANYAKGHNSATLNMVLDLKKGDKVCIKQGHVENYIYSEPNYNFSMFSGFLIS